MARVGNTVNLDGQSRYDLLIFDFPEGFPRGKLDLKFGATPRRISGVEKAVQIFIKTLLTGIGSDVVSNGRGTGFPGFTGAYNLQANSSQEANALIRDAVREAESQAKSILNVTSEGLTSQLESVIVRNIDQINDSTTVQMKLVTRAGETAPIALPFTSLGIRVNE